MRKIMRDTVITYWLTDRIYTKTHQADTQKKYSCCGSGENHRYGTATHSHPRYAFCDHIH
jgi:hypothetical protein